MDTTATPTNHAGAGLKLAPGSTSTPPKGDSDSSPRLAERLREVRVGVRRDLEVTRHLFRGEPAYVVRDPMTMQSHRLDRSDYSVFVAIQPDQPLGECFETLVQRGTVRQEDEESFYQFIMSLHQLSFLNLPIATDQLLYRRYLAKRQARRREKLLGFLFLRVPLINPDTFLERTLRYAQPLFTKWFFGLWLLLMTGAAFVAAARWDQLAAPLHGLQITQNLPLLWITLVFLKVIHEFGHAYACKRLGGYVPEMGVYLIIFTPCAYVDATAAWSFTRKRDRIIVCLAGVYVESIVAALALFVWASSPPGTVRDTAYGLVFLAGVATVLFNINPLMRYDGYYVLSDMLEIPNLRQRSTRYLIDVLKRITLGVRAQTTPAGVKMRAILFGYGTAATAYRVTVLLAIAAVVASRMYTLGLVLAACFLGGMLLRLTKGMVAYLWYARETQSIRGRAVALSALVVVGLPSFVFLMPLPTSVRAVGVIGAEQEQVIHSGVDGFIQQVPVRSGETVAQGDLLLELKNESYTELVAYAGAKLDAAKIRREAMEAVDSLEAQEEAHQVGLHEKELSRWQEEQSGLAVRAPMAGTLSSSLLPRDVGRFVRRGDVLAVVTDGGWQVRAILTQDEVADSRPAVGTPVTIRATSETSRTLTGTINRITPGGTHQVTEPSLTQLGGGAINVHPITGETDQPYFEVTIDITTPLESRDARLHPGMTCQVLLAAEPTPIGRTIARRIMRFVDSLSAR